MKDLPPITYVFAAFIVCVAAYVALSWVEKATGVLDEATLILVGGLAGIATERLSARRS